MTSSPLSNEKQVFSNDSRKSSEFQHEISLETLVSHLLASKLSLSSISTVSRAKEIVISARAALEEGVILTTRARFLKKGITCQAATLQKLRGKIETIYDESQSDFQNVIHALDAANERLESTMNVLRATIVEPAFRPDHEEPRSLLDFVHQQGVETLRDALKEFIREAKEAQTTFDSSILSFDDDLQKLETTINGSTGAQSTTHRTSPIHTLFQTLETHAEEMATLLESLVQHFDLCVTAIRNTEGGTAAVRKATSSQLPGVEAVSVSGVMSAQRITTEEPMPDEEMQEILDVLEKDAAQVEDVVLELRDLLADMEVKHASLLDDLSSLKISYNKSIVAYQVLEVVGSHLPGYILASHNFFLRWEEIKSNIHLRLSELESIRVFYENYYSSYDKLLLEVQRRKHYEENMQSILRKALDQISRVYEADMREREYFCADVGEFLPVDLWPGVGDVAPRWEIQRADDGAQKAIPSLPSAVVKEAEKRIKDRDNVQMS